MAKTVDITDKLSFEANPKIKVKNVTCEVNSDAPTMLKVMQLIGNGDNVTPNDVVSMYELIFCEKDREKIDKLKLQFSDFQTLVMSAMTLVTGVSEQGE
ncbi:hypothetical protein QA584_22640 [Anaerocolumna sp. AGMB13025]|uniref:hypothetical protein n=1 Tax=Anaerocolumna sp. AGMB13025 TaxID=3039116 RepID=UPI00241F5C0E|nr:hypothetical protein [Anaerocolumna sp. AGMB13025]WFR56383.1 hypothetical protein QA584_22640 [Anaerocolumna sp. AGMB13025]